MKGIFEKPKEQLDLFEEDSPRKKIFGDKPDIDELIRQASALDKKPEGEKSQPNSSERVHPRHSKPPYPQGVDGNPIISE